MKENEFELTEQNLEEIVAGIKAQTTGDQIPGMNCPVCKGFIPTTVTMLQMDSAIVCPHCLLKINIERLKDARAVRVHKKVKEAMDALEAKEAEE